MIFNERQLNYLKIKKSKYHSSNGEQLKNSLLNYNVLTDINYMKNLYHNFIYILKQIHKYHIFETGYLYKDFFLDFKSDSNSNINFNNFFTPYDILRDIIYQKGCYLPLITVDKCDNMIAMECVHSKYPTKVLVDLYKNNSIDNRGIFYVKKEFNNNNNIVMEIEIPKKLYDNVIYALDIPVKYIIDDVYESWVHLDIYDKVDLWLIFKVLHKEVSYITGKYAKELYSYGIYPDRFINLGVV